MTVLVVPDLDCLCEQHYPLSGSVGATPVSRTCRVSHSALRRVQKRQPEIFLGAGNGSVSKLKHITSCQEHICLNISRGKSSIRSAQESWTERLTGLTLVKVSANGSLDMIGICLHSKDLALKMSSACYSVSDSRQSSSQYCVSLLPYSCPA